MAKFDLNDDGVVVVVGSGAGGGTLGNELAQKGVKVVILEAGPRTELQDFINNEWESFTQLAWTDMRTTSGNWRVARDFPNLPAWIVKSVGGSTVHWAGASLRFDEHEFKVRSTYGGMPGANARCSGPRSSSAAGIAPSPGKFSTSPIPAPWCGRRMSSCARRNSRSSRASRRRATAR